MEEEEGEGSVEEERGEERVQARWMERAARAGEQRDELSLRGVLVERLDEMDQIEQRLHKRNHRDQGGSGEVRKDVAQQRVVGNLRRSVNGVFQQRERLEVQSK